MIFFYLEWENYYQVYSQPPFSQRKCSFSSKLKTSDILVSEGCTYTTFNKEMSHQPSKLKIILDEISSFELELNRLILVTWVAGVVDNGP